MKRPRKTAKIAVNRVKEIANGLLANDKLTDDQRKVIASMTEQILMETGNYNGFNYVDWLNKGFDEWLADPEHEATSQIDPKYLGNQTKVVFY